MGAGRVTTDQENDLSQFSSVIPANSKQLRLDYNYDFQSFCFGGVFKSFISFKNIGQFETVRDETRRINLL